MHALSADFEAFLSRRISIFLLDVVSFFETRSMPTVLNLPIIYVAYYKRSSLEKACAVDSAQYQASNIYCLLLSNLCFSRILQCAAS